jgi:hypothetical protein
MLSHALPEPNRRLSGSIIHFVLSVFSFGIRLIAITAPIHRMKHRSRNRN